MKRSTLLVFAAVVAIALVGVIAYAQQLGEAGIGPMAAVGPLGPGEFEGMGPSPMAWGRMGQPAIAVSGGYVYVVSGGLLLQYDQGLNLVNHVELPGAGPGAGPGPGAGMGPGGRRGRGGGGGGGGGGMRGPMIR